MFLPRKNPGPHEGIESWDAYPAPSVQICSMFVWQHRAERETNEGEQESSGKRSRFEMMLIATGLARGMLNGNTPRKVWRVPFVSRQPTIQIRLLISQPRKKVKRHSLVDVTCPEHNNLHGHAEG